MDQGKIGAFIAQMRKEKKYTQRQLADLLGISDKTVSKWERGRGLPEVSLMLPLCETLGITVNELLSGMRLDDTAYKRRADENMLHVLRRQNRQILLIAALSVLSAVLVIALGAYLSLRITSIGATWIGKAQLALNTGSFWAETMIFFVCAVIFCAAQILLLRKARIKPAQFLPLFIAAAGLLFCLALYLGAFGTGSPSAAAENRYFAMFLCIPIGGGFVGSLVGILFEKMIGR